MSQAIFLIIGFLLCLAAGVFSRGRLSVIDFIVLAFLLCFGQAMVSLGLN